MRFGDYLKYLGQKYRITNKTLAHEMKVSPGFITHIIKGRNYPNSEQFGSMAKYLRPLIHAEDYYQLTKLYVSGKSGVDLEKVLKDAIQQSAHCILDPCPAQRDSNTFNGVVIDILQATRHMNRDQHKKLLDAAENILKESE